MSPAGVAFAHVTWGFIWLMFVLKIPILMLLGIVWWAVHQTEDPAGDVPPETVPARPHPRSRVPRPRRPRGPHSDGAVLPSPPRVRTVAKGLEPSRDA
jgi:hypothetical protein